MALLDLQIMEQPEEDAQDLGAHSGASKDCGSTFSLLLC